jgi:hypothetical protein
MSLQAVIGGWGGAGPGLLANSGWGGPRPRERSQRIRATLLGRDDGAVRCPRVLRIGFDLRGGQDPLATLEAMLADEGCASPEALRRVIPIPGRPYLCRPDPGTPPSTLGAPRAEVLRQALLLGLSTAQLYDPARPVIWTRASLSRRLALYDPQGFYA